MEKRPCENRTSQELASIKARFQRMETIRNQGSKDVKYVKMGVPNEPHDNNYRPGQGGGNFNNFSGNRPHPTLLYSNSNFLQPTAGFNVSKGGVVEPPTKEQKYEIDIQNIMEVLLEYRKNNEAKIGAVEERLNKLEIGLNIVATIVSIIKIQMDQVQKKAEEDKVKDDAKVANINQILGSKEVTFRS